MSLHLSQYHERDSKASKKSKPGVSTNRSIVRHGAGPDAGKPSFDTSAGVKQRKPVLGNKQASAANDRSTNEVLTLDKDVNEMQLTFDMFKDCVNQFSCLRFISARVHLEMGLDSEVNVTNAFAAVRVNGGAFPDAGVVAMINR